LGNYGSFDLIPLDAKKVLQRKIPHPPPTPAYNAYAPIYSPNCTIHAVVIGLIRKL
jgi:hypothetical protein